MKIDFIVPSFNSKELTSCAIRSFEKNKNNFDFRYIVVENSSNTTYRDDIKALGNVVWIQNPTHLKNSEANAIAIEMGLKHVLSEYVFICHNDVVAVTNDWMNILFNQVEQGCKLVGTVRDPARIEAVHISGLLVDANIAIKSQIWPEYDKENNMLLDVGDGITRYCRENSIKQCCFENTFNNEKLINFISNEELKNFHVDRALDLNDNVFYMHLGRGTQKQQGLYNKPNRIYHDDWINFAKQFII